MIRPKVLWRGSTKGSASRHGRPLNPLLGTPGRHPAVLMCLSRPRTRECQRFGMISTPLASLAHPVNLERDSISLRIHSLRPNDRRPCHRSRGERRPQLWRRCRRSGHGIHSGKQVHLNMAPRSKGVHMGSSEIPIRRCLLRQSCTTTRKSPSAYPQRCRTMLRTCLSSCPRWG